MAVKTEILSNGTPRQSLVQCCSDVSARVLGSGHTTGSMTLEELRNIRLRVYGVRGNSNQNTNYYFRFYGATLSVTYAIEGRDFNSDFNSDFK